MDLNVNQTFFIKEHLPKTRKCLHDKIDFNAFVYIFIQFTMFAPWSINKYQCIVRITGQSWFSVSVRWFYEVHLILQTAVRKMLQI